MVHCLIPTHVHHDGGAIYSIDCHPFAEKFLTCGQGDVGGSGLVMVWNQNPIKSTKAFQDKSVPRSLCQIRLQAGANCCRWSPDGNRFAVGSDDSSVSVYEFQGRVNSAGSVLGASAASVERYKECAILRSHSMEVLGVEWSPNGKYLATCSIDNLVCIWNAKNLHEKVATLKGHEGSVKGISWDPIGKYFASISADKTLKLWHTDNWQCATTISKPFETSGQTTMFSRLDWTPDGKYLMAPTSMNNEGPTVQIIERQSWNTERDLVGHRKATTCIRVITRILCYSNKNNKKIQVSCIAVGSRDKGISIWLIPGLDRPVLAITRLFKHTVMDLSWSGESLFICSQDGSIAVLSFKEEEIGLALTASAMSDLCHKTYCIRPPQYEENSGTIEDESNGAAAHDSSFNSSFITCPEEVIAKRKKEEELSKASSQSTETAAQNGSANSLEVTKAHEIQKTKEKKLIEERNKQVEERKDGKRRIQPIFLGSTTDEAPIVSKPPPPPTLEKANPLPPKRSRIEEDEEDLSSEDDDDEDEDEEEEEDDDDEENDEDEDMETSDDEKTRKRKRHARNNDNMVSKNSTKGMVLAANFKKPSLRPLEPRTMRVIEGTAVMDAPEQQSSFIHPVSDKKGLHIEVDNKWKHGGIETSCVRLIRRRLLPNTKDIETEEAPMKTTNEQVWMIVVPAPVIVAAANKHYCIIGCGDRCVRIYRMKCTTNMACLLLDSLPISLGVREHAAYVLTEYGKLSTWDLKKPTVIVSKQAIFECVTKDTSLSSLDISERAIPLLSFSNGAIYTFGVEFGCWERVDLTTQMHRLTSTLDANQLPDGPLGRLLKKMRGATRLGGTAPGVAVSVSRCVKETQIHQWLHCAEMLGDAKDYKGILAIYVEHLCEYGNEEKLRTVLSQLSTGTTPICGVKRAALRDDVVKVIEQRQPQIAAKLIGSYSFNSNGKKTSLF